MAKKNRNNGNKQYSTWDIVKFCAYVALAVAAVAAILAFIFGLLSYCGVKISWAGTVTGAFSTISQIALLVAAVIPAYYFTRGKSAVVKAFFWVAVIFIVLGLVGINLGFHL